MSRKYIKELLSYNFVYPNNTVPEYDLEIVHDINNNSVSGTVATFTGLLTSSTGITINMSGTWNLNGAEPYINDVGNVNIFSVHMMDITQNYYRPWSLVFNKSVSTGTTTYSYNETFSVTPSMVGVTGFTAGTYYFEVRMIGHRAVFPICVTIPISSTPAPSPTPTATATGCTQSNVCAAIVVTGATGPEVYAGSISYNNCYGVLVNENFVNDGTYYRCIQYVSGLMQVFSQTGISSITIYGGNCNTFSCPTGTTLTPTPTPSGTGLTPTPTTSSTPTPTPTPSNTALTPTPTSSLTPTPTSSLTPTPTTTAPPSCVISVGFDVDSAGEVRYIDCCGITKYVTFGVGPQVINDCLQYGSLFATSATISFINYSVTSCNCPTPTPTPTFTPTPSATSSSPVRVDWYLKAAAKASLQVLSNTSSLLLDETSAGTDRSGTIYVALSDLPYTVVGNWASGSGNIVRYNICDTGNGGEVYASGPIDAMLGSESYLVTPTPLWITINVVGNNTTPPTCP
jgi:hypothetical protein